jgi:hypothetical protein
MPAHTTTTSRRTRDGGSRLALYADAARAVHLRQAAGRTRRLVPADWILLGARLGRAPGFHELAAGLLADDVPQSAPGPTAGETGTFAAVGVRRRFAPSRAFWTDRTDGLLFLFHLHGFAELPRSLAGDDPSPALGFWERVTTSWLDLFERPELPAWHPYPTSVRLISWSVALSARRWPEDLRGRVAESLWRQAHYLRRSVEYDIGGNHLLKNAGALVCAGVSFDDARLLRRGLRLLERELPRQFPLDGGHVERSSSYHREALHDLRQVAALLRRAGRAVPPAIDRAIDRATAWSRAVAGPDGRLPLLGDAWDGPPVAGRRDDDVTVLADSGHVVLRHRRDQVLFDCGELGPRHLPAHAHAGALSFLAWFDGEPLAVDRGAFTYSGPRRDLYRGTATHNTVEIGGRDQCVFWGDFRAARLPAVELGPLRRQGDVVLLGGGHDGYRRQAGGPIHQRVVVWLPGDGLLVIDRVASRRAHEVRSHLHLDPAAAVDDGRIGTIAVAALGALPTRLVPGLHAPWLGSEVAAAAFVQAGVVAPGELFGWSLLRDGAAVLQLDEHGARVRRRGGGVLDLALDWPAAPGAGSADDVAGPAARWARRVLGAARQELGDRLRRARPGGAVP